MHLTQNSQHNSLQRSNDIERNPLPILTANTRSKLCPKAHRSQLAGRCPRAFISPTSGCSVRKSLPDSRCVHTGIPCICPVTTFPCQGSRAGSCSGLPADISNAVEELWQLPLLLPKVKLQSLMQGRAQQHPQQSGPQSPKGCNVQDTARCKTRTRLSLEEPAAVFTPSLPQLCTDCLKTALK